MANKKNVTYSLSQPHIDWVAEYARRTTRTKSGVVELALDAYATRAGADLQDLAGPDNGGQAAEKPRD